MAALVASVFVFLALVTAAVAVFGPARSGARSSEGRLRSLRPAGKADDAQQTASASRRRSRSAIPVLGNLLSGSSWADSAAIELERANIQLRVGEYLLGRVVLAVLVFFLVAFIARFHPIGIVAGVASGVAGYLLPGVYVRFLQHRRVADIEKQLIELLPMLASSLRSGFAFQQSIELATEQLSAPLADELHLLLQDVNLGATMDTALQDLGRRVGSADLDMIITAVQIQRSTGGNLSEVLEQTGETLRERDRIRGDLQTLTAQQRLTGLVLSLYPIGIGLVLLALMPSVWSLMFTETLGQIALGIALGLQLLGFFAIRRLTNIEI